MDGDSGNVAAARLLHGDVLEQLASVPSETCSLVVSSPPYNIRKPYERGDKRNYEEYIAWQLDVIKSLCAKVSENGSVCWQVGTYVSDGEIFPLDLPFVEMFRGVGF